MMESYLPTDLRAVWLVRSRKLWSDAEFWLTLIGYDRKEHSFGSWIYLVYVFIFLSVWIFAALVLLADFTGQVLRALPFNSPLLAATAVGAFALTAVFLVELYAASRRSPFVFSEADATLLCLTPVDRRWVALIWFLGEWVSRGIFLWCGAVVLGYGHLEAQFPGELTTADLPRYLLAGLRMLAVIIPLHLGMQSAAWAVGTWRLSWERDRKIIRLLAPFLAGLVVAALVFIPTRGETHIPVWTWGLTFPIQAGLGGASLPEGVGFILVWASAGLLLLWLVSKGMSLARAAQETRDQELLQSALLFGASDLAGEIRQQKRLGAEKKPSRLPIRPGLAALLWKNAVQGMRAITLVQILQLAAIPGIGLAIFQIPDLFTRGGLIVLWIAFVSERFATPLRKDLSHWWLLRQYPFSSEQIVISILARPLVVVALAVLVTLLLAALVRVPVPPAAAWLSISGALGVALATALDIFRQCRSGKLLEGNVPERSVLTIVLGAFLFGISGGVVWLLSAILSFPGLLTIPLALCICAAVDYGLFRWAGYLLRNIR